jgi:16S rRNA (uracil1498-N3)-methyltransferase
MPTPRFFCPESLSPEASIDLPEDAARHACRVLRLRVGDELTLFDGRGGEYAARIAAVDRQRVRVDVGAWRDVECEAPIDVTLVQALQSGEKMDMTIQKAVELGVARIVPVASKRSVVRLEGARAQRRVDHWRAVVVSACEQCGRNRVPQVAEITELGELADWLATPGSAGGVANGDVLRLMLAPGAAQTLADVGRPAPGVRVELLIGAEGGLAPDEIDRARAAGYRALRLGPRVLRTETAGLAALAAIQCLWGDF